MTLADNGKLEKKTDLIFDFDGTIFKLDWTHGEPLDVYRSRIWDMIGEIDPELPAKFDKGSVSYNLTDEAIRLHGERAKKRIFHFYEEKEKTLIPKAEPIPEMIDFLKDNYDKYNFHIWSSNVVNTINTLLEGHNLLSYFEKIIGRDSVDFAKPHPGGFDQIYKGDDRSKYLMIGDSEFSDGGAAQNVGIDFYQV